ncbi:MAG: hypothetical protein Greene101449_408 [Candidatus Peregrinibacteria bacterium Greene1014_49]|nr:MAG: hypothetical protein Greene101449_408 [Candidatus Peregrinibacteria bacterium Greene1014_49]
MPLTTRTFEELRKSNTDALERAHYTPNLEIEKLRKRRRERIQNLLEQGKYIEQLASVDDQKIASGIERNGKEVMQISTIQDDKHFKRFENQDLHNYIWNVLPDGIFKRFQELYCRPEHLIVPRYHINPNGYVTFEVDVRSLSLDLCLVSPDLIKDEFAQNTKLCEFTEDDNPLKRLEKKRAAIPKLKSLFAAAQPLQKGHHRFFVIKEPGNEKSHDTILEPEIAGTLLHIRNGRGEDAQNKKKSGPNIHPLRRRTVQHFKSAYSALRKPSHQTKNHDRELLQLTRLQVETEDLRRQCGTWKKTTPITEKTRIRDAGNSILATAEDILQDCKDIDKVKAAEKFAKVRPLLESSNPSAAMTTLLSGIGLLQERLTKMHPISGFNEQDRMTLMHAVAKQELIMRTYRKRLAIGTASFDKVSLPPNVSAMGIDPEALLQISLQPLATFAGRMQKKQVVLDAALTEGNREHASRTAVEMHIIGKLQGLRSCIDTIQLSIAGNCAIPVEDIEKFVQYFTQRQLLPQIIVPEYEQVFEKHRIDLSGIQVYIDQQIDVQPREEMYGQLKKYLDSLAIEDSVRALP